MRKGTGIGVGAVLALTLLAGTARSAAPRVALAAQPDKARQLIDQATDRVAELQRAAPAASSRDQGRANEMIRNASRHLAVAQYQLETGDPYRAKLAQREAERALLRLSKAQKLQEGVR